jgi:hypothetical protein
MEKFIFFTNFSNITHVMLQNSPINGKKWNGTIYIAHYTALQSIDPKTMTG